MVTIYMPLLNEGTDVWRPVEATPQGKGIYRVEGPMNEDEEWAFAPGTLVRCEWKTFSGGERRLTAVGVTTESPALPVIRMSSPSAMMMNKPQRSAKWCASTFQYGPLH